MTCTLVARGNVIVLSGEEESVALAEQLLNELLFLYRQGLPAAAHDVRYSVRMIVEGRQASLHRMFAETILVTLTVDGKLRPKLLANGTIWKPLERIR